MDLKGKPKDNRREEKRDGVNSVLTKNPLPFQRRGMRGGPGREYLGYSHLQRDLGAAD